jgi:hypothetical protein
MFLDPFLLCDGSYWNEESSIGFIIEAIQHLLATPHTRNSRNRSSEYKPLF